MESLISRLVEGRFGLMDKGMVHAVKETRRFAHNSTRIAEGKEPDWTKDDENTQIKKLEEQRPGEEEEEPPMSATEKPDREAPPEDETPPEDEAPPEDEDEEEGIEKEYFGKTEDTFFYLVRADQEAGGEGEEGEGTAGDLQIVDAEGKVIFSAKENELDSSDVFHFLVAAVREVEPDDVSYDVFTKYVIPKIEELEKQEEGEEGMEGEEAGPELPPEEEGEEGEPPVESKNESKSLSEVKVVFDRREFDVELIGTEGNETIIEISGKRFNFSPEFSKMFRGKDGKISEENLKELALDALANLKDDEFDMLATKARKVEKEIEDSIEKKVDSSTTSASVPSTSMSSTPSKPDVKEKDSKVEKDLTDKSDSKNVKSAFTSGMAAKKEKSKEEKESKEVTVEEKKSANEGCGGMSKKQKAAVAIAKNKAKAKKKAKECIHRWTKLTPDHNVICESCGESRTVAAIQESADISKDVKELINATSSALKAGDYVKTAELAQRLQTIQQAIPGDIDVDAGKEEEGEKKDHDEKDETPEEEATETPAEQAAEEEAGDTKVGIPAIEDEEMGESKEANEKLRGKRSMKPMNRGRRVEGVDPNWDSEDENTQIKKLTEEEEIVPTPDYYNLHERMMAASSKMVSEGDESCTKCGRQAVLKDGLCTKCAEEDKGVEESGKDTLPVDEEGTIPRTKKQKEL